MPRGNQKRHLATISDTSYGRANSAKRLTVKPATVEGGDQIGYALLVISSVSTVDQRCYYTVYLFSGRKLIVAPLSFLIVALQIDT
jgi:hypothetical protein